MDVVHRIESCGTSYEGEVRTEVHVAGKNTIDELVAFRPRRSAYICGCGEIGGKGAPRNAHPSLGLALEDSANGPAAKRQKLASSEEEEMSLFHLLKKHKDCRNPKTWRGVAVTCAKGKAKNQVQSLRKRVEAASSAVQAFADLAREHSDDPSAQRGGDLGVVDKGSLEAELEDVAFALGPGQLSEVIETHEGIHLFLRATS
jgi:hypothetical protein